MTYDPNQDAFWTPVCGVYRHDDLFKSHGRYYLVLLPEALETVKFFSSDWDHQYAVCDDFGNLVRVQ